MRLLEPQATPNNAIRSMRVGIPVSSSRESVGSGFKNVLSQAQPNPFNQVTNIAYSIKEAGPVVIEVHNVAGKVVQTLTDTELEAGATGYVVWDGSNDRGEKCASGMYFCRMNASGFTATKTMVMFK